MGQNLSQNNVCLRVLIEDVAAFNIQAEKQYVISAIKWRLSAKVIQKQSQFLPISLEKSIEIQVCDILTEKCIIQRWLSIYSFYELNDLIKAVRESSLNIQLEGQARNFNDEEKKNVCEICFLEETTIGLNCGHSFCKKCISDWLIKMNQNSCPMCRGKLNKQLLNAEHFYLLNDTEVLQTALKRIRNLIIDQ